MYIQTAKGNLMSFENMGLAPQLLFALKKADYTKPTPVQSKVIPLGIENKDLIVTSETGSGKTAAFMLPALNKIATRNSKPSGKIEVLVLTPTRELAQQIAKATKTYASGIKGFFTTTVVGGMPYGPQIRSLSKRNDVLVATPGRLIDHIQSKKVDLSGVHTLVLDEADRMLDMGFIGDINIIVEKLPKQRHTMLFSATLESNVKKLAANLLNEPHTIEITPVQQKHDNIQQNLLHADNRAHKLRMLDYLLRDVNLNQAIVFTTTKRGADELADTLVDNGFSAAALHGDMNQRQRTRTITQMQRRNIQILVATDVAARGIDISGISHAINFEPPIQAEDYVHRIGRTGRAGRFGQAFTMVANAERSRLRAIERYIGMPIPKSVIDGLEPTTAVDEKPKKKRSSSRKGKPSYGAKPASRAGAPRSRSDSRPGSRAGSGAGPKAGASKSKRSGEPRFGKGTESAKRSMAAKPGSRNRRSESRASKPDFSGRSSNKSFRARV